MTDLSILGDELQSTGSSMQGFARGIAVNRTSLDGCGDAGVETAGNTAEDAYGLLILQWGNAIADRGQGLLDASSTWHEADASIRSPERFVMGGE